MNNDSTSHDPAASEPSALLSSGLHRYIARTLRVNSHHLPWAIAQQIHREHHAQQGDDAPQSNHAGLLILELDDYSWRAEVTADNIAAAQALGWHELRRLLRLAQAHACEALELAGDNLALPAVLGFEVFQWS
ncbi:MAG: hypothetical protein WA159_18940 [Variovorax sp.]